MIHIIKDSTIAIVGMGSIGKRHARNLLSLGYTNLVLCETNQESHATLAQEFPGKQVTADYTLVLHEANAVFVCTPTRFHVPVINAALDNNCHVFVEKPLSHNVGGVPELIAKAQEKNKLVMVGFNLPYHPCLKKIKELLQKNTLGKVSSARAVFGSYMPNWRQGDYTKMYSACSDLGGGVILDSIHELDYLRWLFGEPEKSVALAGKRTNLEIDVEDTADILLLFQKNIQANIHLNYANHAYTRSLEIVGEKGTLYWELKEGKVKFYNPEKKQWDILLDKADYDFNQTYLDEVQDFFTCIQNNTPPRSTAEDALASLCWSLQAKESNTSNIWDTQ